MIPYEELCEALARWRARQGMNAGAARRRSAPPRSGPVDEESTRVAHGADAANRRGAGAVAGYASYPPDADLAGDAALPPGHDPPVSADYVGDDATAIQDMASIEPRRPTREDSTNEIDIDSLDVVDEQDAP